MPTRIHERLTHVVEGVVRSLDGVAHAALAMPDGGDWSAVVHSHPAANELLEVERRSGGPIFSAIESGRISRLPTSARQNLYPEYARFCASRGIHCVAAFPIAVDGELRGVLSVASFDHFGVGVEEMKVCVACAGQMALILRAASLPAKTTG